MTHKIDFKEMDTAIAKGEKPKEIAARLGCNPETVRRRIRSKRNPKTGSKHAREMVENLELSGDLKVLADVFRRAFTSGSVREQIDAVKLLQTHRMTDRCGACAYKATAARVEDIAASYHALLDHLAGARCEGCGRPAVAGVSGLYPVPPSTRGRATGAGELPQAHGDGRQPTREEAPRSTRAGGGSLIGTIDHLDTQKKEGVTVRVPSVENATEGATEEVLSPGVAVLPSLEEALGRL